MHSRVAQLIIALALATGKVNAAQEALNLNAKVEHTESSQCTAKPNKPSKWGHLHVVGSIESVEFFTALFSDEFPCEPLNLVIGEPADGCAKMQNQVAGAAVLVDRGECPFSEKADNIAKAGGRAMILTNTIENSLFGMPSSNMTAEERKSSLHDKIASVMIRERSGGLLKHLIHASPDAKVLVNGEFASDSAGYTIEDCGTCKAGLDGMAEMSSEEVALFKSKPRGGRVFASFSKEKLLQDEIVFSNEDEGMELDFFVGYTGSSIPVHTTGTLAVLDDENRYACEPINQVYPKGTVLLVERGECVFSEKFKNAYMAGVWVVLVINSDNELVIPGFPEAEMDKTSISFNPGTLVAGPTVFHKSGLRLKQMVKEAVQPVSVTFRPTDVTISDVKSLDAIDKLALLTKSEKLDVQEITKQLGLDAEAVNKLNSMP